jgi:threonine-phosphate decarboxylase
VSLAAQELASACLQDQPYFAGTRQLLQQERQRLKGMLSPYGHVAADSKVNYLLFVPRITVDKLVSCLRMRGILVRDARDFAGLEQPSVRIAVKRPKDSERMLSGLREIYFGEEDG